MRLAIKGHNTRFREVKQLLQQLGGQCSGYSCAKNEYYYYINSHWNIEGTTQLSSVYSWRVFDLEEFEQLYPFKVKDTVLYTDRANNTRICTITGMWWDKIDNAIKYVLDKTTSVSKTYLKKLELVKNLEDYLKPGHVIELDNGSRFIIVQDVHGNAFGIEIGKNAYCWHSLEQTRSIRYVYQIDRPYGVHLEHADTNAMTKVWERTEVELTMQEIADKFGIDVNQLKIKK